MGKMCPNCKADANGNMFFGNRLIKCLECGAVFCGKCGHGRCPFCGNRSQSKIRFMGTLLAVVGGALATVLS